jgi:hypothetical protein
MAIETVTALTQEYDSYSRSPRTRGKRISESPEHADCDLTSPHRQVKPEVTANDVAGLQAGGDDNNSPYPSLLDYTPYLYYTLHLSRTDVLFCAATPSSRYPITFVNCCTLGWVSQLPVWLQHGIQVPQAEPSAEPVVRSEATVTVTDPVLHRIHALSIAISNVSRILAPLPSLSDTTREYLNRHSLTPQALFINTIIVTL